MLTSQTTCMFINSRLLSRLNGFRIMSLTDSEFQEFVEILDNSQGNMLRQYSAAVAPMVRALTAGYSEHQQGMLDFEQVSMGDILKHPKGSPELLNLIQELTARTPSSLVSEPDIVVELWQDNLLAWGPTSLEYT